MRRPLMRPARPGEAEFFQRRTLNVLIGIIAALLLVGIILGIIALATRETTDGENPDNFSFAAMGDFNYWKAPTPNVENILLNVINKEQPLFLVHVGDSQPDTVQQAFQNNEPEPEALTETQWRVKRDWWYRATVPVFFTPGDNDWADTIKPPTSNSDPIGVLDAIRQVWFKEPRNVLPPFTVVSQPSEQPQHGDYIENLRWVYKSVVFVTIHTIGGANGRNPSMAAAPADRQTIIDESVPRIAANSDWLNRAFDVAINSRARGLVIMTHANPSYESFDIADFNGFEDQAAIIRNRTIDAIPQNLQVLFVRADTHLFGVSKPIPLLFGYPAHHSPVFNIPEELQTFVPTFTEISVPGDSAFGLRVSAGPGRVRVDVDFDDPGLFKISSSLTS